MDNYKVRVEPGEDEANGTFSFKASTCCDYKLNLLIDLRQALSAFPIKMVKEKEKEIVYLFHGLQMLVVILKCFQ